MRKDRRLFGNNLKVLLAKKGIETKDFAQKMDCTEYELCQIMDARLILDTEEENMIADTLGVSVEALYKEMESSEYEAVGCMEYRGVFSNPENEKLILDLFDIYCDIQETIAEEQM